MQNELDIEALKVELADKRAMLADLESGKNWLPNPWEGREAGLRRRIADLESTVEKGDASRP
jgi:hypothetical protein